jgi:hypothetical protein
VGEEEVMTAADKIRALRATCQEEIDELQRRFVAMSMVNIPSLDVFIAMREENVRLKGRLYAIGECLRLVEHE